MAEEIGYVPAERLAEKDEEIAALEAALEESELARQEAEDALKAIDVIESQDFRARKRRGPKPKTPVEA